MMIHGPNFFDYLSQRLLAIAAKKNEEYVMGPDGKLEKGHWITMHGTHVFILNGKIQAGPPSTIGKSPDELDWEDVFRQERRSNPIRGAVREDVSTKYRDDLVRVMGLKGKARADATDKLWHKMAAEDDFHLIFLNTEYASSGVLDSLAKAFSDYGSFPASGTYKERVTFYNDRIALLHELASALPKDAKADANVHIAHITDQLNDMKAKAPLSEREAEPEPEAPEPQVHVHQPSSQPSQQPQPSPKATTSTTPSRVTPTQPQSQQQQPSTSITPATKRPKRGPAQVTHTVVPGGTPPPNRPAQNNVLPKQQPVYNIKHRNPALDRAWMQVKYLTFSATRFIIAALCKYIQSSQSMKKSTAFEIKKLYSFTKDQLSRINVSERDSIYDAFLKSFGLA